MLVEQSDHSQVFYNLKDLTQLSLDTETTGLYPWQGDRLFSLIIGSQGREYYFDFSKGVQFKEDLLELFGRKEITWFMHNAKFDMAMLYQEGFEIAGTIHDTQVMARILDNSHMKYSLEMCALRIGEEKSDAVEKYILEHGLVDGTGKDRKKRYDKVPLHIIRPYAEQDAKITFKLGQYQVGLAHSQGILDVYENECKLTKTCFQMEKVGVSIDEEKCKERIQVEEQRCLAARLSFESLSGHKFIDSNKSLSKVFATMGIETEKTQKGNPSITKKTLENKNTDISNAVVAYREAKKRKTTYYENFLKFSKDDIIHANIRQAGTLTGRFSYSDPALQTIPSIDEEVKEKDMEVKECFIPRDGFCFVEIDYKAMEFRMLVNYSDEKHLARSISNGNDPHEATAIMVGIGRKQAKTLNFGLLYGMGVDKLSKQLNMSREDAVILKRRYFERLPGIRNIIYRATKKAEREGFVTNWFKRRYQFKEPKFSYKAINHIIQGGCAEVVKVAMNRIQDVLTEGNFKSRMLLQLHDAILFEVSIDELLTTSLVTGIKDIMENVFTLGILKLECSVKHSFISWADLKEGMPVAPKARD